MGLLIILLSVFCYGISNGLWVLPLRRMNFLELIMLRSFLSAILFGICIVLDLWTFSSFGLENLSIRAVNTKDLILGIGICIFCYFGLFFYVLSLNEEKVSVAVPVSSMNAFFGILFSVIVLDEVFRVGYWIAVLLFIIGLFLINRQTFNNHSLRLSKGVLYNLAAAFFWGIGFAAFAIPVKTMGVLLFSFILEGVVCVCSLFLYRFINGKYSFPVSKIDAAVFGLALLGFGGLIFYNLSLAYIPVTVASLMGILTPVVSIVYSSVYFKERLGIIQYAGIMLILIGLWFLQ